MGQHPNINVRDTDSRWNYLDVSVFDLEVRSKRSPVCASERSIIETSASGSVETNLDLAQKLGMALLFCLNYYTLKDMNIFEQTDYSDAVSPDLY